MRTYRFSLNVIIASGLAITFAFCPTGPARAEDKMSYAPPRDAATHLYGYHIEGYLLDPGPHLFIDWRYVCSGYNPYYRHEGKVVERDRPEGVSESIIPDIKMEPRSAPYGLRLEAIRPEKLGPVIKPEKDWEFFTPYVTLIHHDGKYKLFYNTTTFRENYVVCYAESTDGIHYIKPNLGVIEFRDSKENNIVLGPGVCEHQIHGPGVFVDPHGPPEERFKALYLTTPNPAIIEKVKNTRPESVSAMGKDHKVAMMGAVSPDGIHWRELDEAIMIHYSDTGTTAYWDEKLQRYVGYFRMHSMERRAIGRAETTDYHRWPAPEMILWPHSNEESFVDYYTNGKSLYPGTLTMHLMFPMIYHRNLDTSFMRTASSLEGICWSFLPGGNVLGPGKAGEFDAGCIFPGAGLAEIPGDRVVLPYCGFTRPHKHPRLENLGDIALAVWPKERLGALVADENAEFWTIRLRTKGTSLWLNFETDYNGQIEVEVEGVKGRTYANCDPLKGNHIKKQVVWNNDGNINIKPGGQFVLKFRMRAAKLYSFEVK